MPPICAPTAQVAPGPAVMLPLTTPVTMRLQVAWTVALVVAGGAVYVMTLSGNLRPQDLDFNLGSGGPLIHITTGNGAIRLKRADSQ